MTKCDYKHVSHKNSHVIIYVKKEEAITINSCKIMKAPAKTKISCYHSMCTL